MSDPSKERRARRRRSPSGALAACTVAAATFVLLPPAHALAQLGSTGRVQSSEKPRVFLDCQDRRNCDFDHFRTEITFVDWVRDRTDADVHVIFTSTGTGGGGNRYTLDFVGRGELDRITDQLTYTSLGTDVRAEVVDGLARTLEIGLFRYAVQTGEGRNFELSYTGVPGSQDEGGDLDSGGRVGSTAYYDPWNSWTFRFGLSGNMTIRERSSNTRINPSISANRVTERWKTDLSIWTNLTRERRELSDGTEVRNDQDNWRTSALVVRSVTDHVSVGMDSGARNSVRNNQRARVRLQPAVEWNYYPYMQATRRQLIAHYSAGVEHTTYYEETVFGHEQQTIPLHRVAVQYRAREEWGNAGVGLETAQYLHDTGFYSFGLGGDLSFRVARGLELNVSGSAAFINDNIHIPASDFSDEDILLGRVSLPSSYEYEASVGFNYRWGSATANVVNNRFPGSVRDN